MNKRVCVVTGTRAEYGLFYPVMKEIKNSDVLDLQLVVSTMHLSEEFGLTYKQIEADGFEINEKIENLLMANSKAAVAKSTGLATILLSDAFSRLKPNIILLLGDRFETHAAATTAMLMNIPIAHIHGGEITEGAVDDKIRHSITKMALLHFTSTEEYRRRVIQLGESPDRVICTGAPGIDNIINMPLLNQKELEAELNWKLPKLTALFTFHAETLALDSEINQIELILESIKMSGIGVLFTYANADDGGLAINQAIDKFVNENKVKYKVEKSLGQLKYLSAMSHVNLLIGNSSSGIIEAASFNVPVINIGDRQKGRLQSENVRDCELKNLELEIENALFGRQPKQRKKIKNIYGDGNAASKIVKQLIVQPMSNVKRFHDL
jgi:UDP-hydrolysing UDP-N-acetyl-D-glucosamine 2-epimerase